MTSKIPSVSFTPAEYLARASGSIDIRAGLPVDSAPSFYAGYLALCQGNPELVHERFTSRHHNYKHELTQLQVIVGLAPHFSQARDLKEVPTTLEQLAPLAPQQANDVNGEWVSAVLMACGVDPWDIVEYSSPGNCGHQAHLHPVPQMAARGWSGVLRNALIHPSAPAIEQVAQMELGSWNEVRTLRAFALCQEDTSVLQVLHEGGMGLPADEKLLVEELGQSSKQAIEYLSKVGVLDDIPAKLRKRTENAFVARVKSKSLNKDDMATISGLLMGQQGLSPDEVAQSAMFDGILSVPWCDNSYSNERHANYGVAKLNETGTSKSQLKGNWSFLGAQMMALVRRTGSSGSARLDLEEMIHSVYQNQKWEKADVFSEKYKGCLAPAVNVQWRDGISMAAPMLMYLLSLDSGFSSPSKNPDLDIKKFSSAAGISDFTQFVIDHADEMALFTAAITRNNSPVQHKLLGRVWNLVLSSNYGSTLAKAISEENRINVLLALTGNFSSSKNWDTSGVVIKSQEIQAFNGVVKKFFPYMKGHSDLETQFMELREKGQGDSPQAHAVLISALTGGYEISEVLAAAQPSITSKSTCSEILKMWMNAYKKDPEHSDTVSQVKAALLASVAAEGGVRHSNKTARVKM